MVGLKVSFDLYLIPPFLFLLKVLLFQLKPLCCLPWVFHVLDLNKFHFPWISHKLAVSSRAFIKFRVFVFVCILFERTLYRWY